MPFDVSGNFTRSYNFVQDRDNGLKIMASRVDGEFDNFATGMNLVFFRDGRVPMSADLRMNINGITGIKDGAVGSPAIKFNTDTTTGPYLDGLNRYAISVNATRRMVATTTGVDVTGQLSASTNLRVVSSVALPTPTGNGFCDISGNSGAGMNLIGQGSLYDISFYNSAGSRRAAINSAGTWEFFGAPLSTTAAVNTNNTQIATTAFVQAQLANNAYAPLASPTFTGVPAAPTAAGGTNTTQIATTAFVANATAGLASLTGGNSFTGAQGINGVVTANTFISTVNSGVVVRGDGTTEGGQITLGYIASTAITGQGPSTWNIDVNSANALRIFNVDASSVTRVPITIAEATGVVTFSATPVSVTPATSDNNTNVATTAFVKAQAYAPLASPTFTGTPASVTPATADNTTKIATTAYVQANLVSYAPLASPTFTGSPVAPTAAAGTNTTQIATTAFVQTAVGFNTQTVASSATVTPTFSNDIVNITAQAAALNLANWTGTAVDFTGLVIRIKDNGTARAITYGTNYLGIDNVTLPSTTIVGKTHELCFEHNSTTGKHMCVSAITY